MQITDSILRQITPNCPKVRRFELLPILNKVCLDYEIVTELRVAAFLATLAQESGEFKYTSELASGDAYDTRTDLGNTPQRDGDGRFYKGHGDIQITGKTNHRLYTEYLRQKGHLPFIDFVKHPQKLAEQPYALDSAGWFFAVHINANPLADKRKFLTIQIRVNGQNRKTGLPNHWNERKSYYERALRVLPDNLMISNQIEHLANILEDDEYSDFIEIESATPATSALPTVFSNNNLASSETRINQNEANNPETATTPIQVEKEWKDGADELKEKKGNVLDSLQNYGEKAQTAVNKLDELQTKFSPISNSSKFLTLWQYFVAFFFVAVGFVKDNWILLIICLICAVACMALGAFIYSKAKDRAVSKDIAKG